MAVTVQTKVTDYQDLVPFFYLRITGLPFYVFATVNPSDSRYGPFAWSTPNSFPAASWAQRGLKLPDDTTIEQKFTDIIGGIASPGRVSLSVIDFPDPNHPGVGFFSRLFAPGRALTDTSILKANLNSPMLANSDTTIQVIGSNGTWTAPRDVYVGAETIGIFDVSDEGGGAWELDFHVPPSSDGGGGISGRNKYVCFGNSADGGTYWPPTPYHRINSDASGILSESPTVSGEAIEVLGRTAALWMGHMRPDGNPEPESSSACLLLGRISGLEIGKVGGTFDIAIDSITADLTKGLAAPDLAQATIQDGYYITASQWQSFWISSAGSTYHKVTIPAATYATPQAVANAVNSQLGANSDLKTVTLQIRTLDDGTNAFTFVESSTTNQLVIVTRANFQNAQPAVASLLYVLGFEINTDGSGNSGALSGDINSPIVANRSVARVFIETSLIGTQSDILLSEANVGGYFFNDQGDGTAKAWARFGDGQIVQVLSSSGGSSNSIKTGNKASPIPFLVGPTFRGSGVTSSFYYVEQQQTATVEQVIVYYSSLPNAPAFVQLLGMLLASTPGHNGDGVLNIFPEGVGLGWLKLLTASDWTGNDEVGVHRMVTIDASTKWADLFTPYAREHGKFLVWDPANQTIRLRQIVIPQSSYGAGTVALNETNRARSDDRTSQRADRASLRTSWKLSSPTASLVINDVRARAMYPNDARQESITDNTLVDFATLGTVIEGLVKKYGAPWTVCQRSMNKRGMLLAPGTIHQVIDNTMVNPFTGASGITSADAIYCFLTRVAVVPGTGAVTVEFAIDSVDDRSLYRQWSPCGLIDFDAATHGYVAATKTLTMKAHFGPSGANDALSFEAGDVIFIRTRDNSDDTATSEINATIASVGATTIVLTTDITAVSSTVESLVMLRKYTSATTSRQSGASKVSWQGDGDARLIQSTARLNKWG